MAVTGGVVERFPSSKKRTMSCSAAVTAGRLVEITGNRTVAHAAAASLKVYGVALQDYDGVATTGSKIAVARDGVWNLTATGAIAAGDQVIAAANGTVATLAAAAGAVAADINNSRAIVGIALEAITGGAAGPVELGLPG